MCKDKNNKLIVRLFGGLGNQLFIYSTSRSLALRNNAELVIDDITGFKYDQKYKRLNQLKNFKLKYKKANSEERLEPFSRIRRFLKRKLNNFKQFKDRDYIFQNNRGFDNRINNFQIKGKVFFEGYWQSEKYFKDFENQIRKDLKILPPNDKKNLETAKQIKNKNSVAVHFRFFDNETLSNNNASLEYYKKSIKLMESKFKNLHYFIFSDKKNISSIYLPLKKTKFTFINHNKGDKNAYADLWLMSQSKYFITANSTFSWWGAWLSEYSKKVVITPKMKLQNNNKNIITSWGFQGQIPTNWIKV